MNRTTLISPELHANAGRLLLQAGFPNTFDLIPLSGGANSKAFRIEMGGDRAFFLKEYFQHPDDPRDRLGTEFTFSSFAWAQGVRTIAQPIAMNRATHSGLYSFLVGVKVKPDEITLDSIDQCVQFYQSINACKTSMTALRLPVASEACFTLVDHFQCLQRRVQRLEAITPRVTIDRQALEFMRVELAPVCAKQIQSAQALAAQLDITPEAPIADQDRSLSPSDFGFHNVLQRDDHMLQFLDFEYAGWDDPAKTVCDFFCQPACPVPSRFYADFANRIAETTMNPGPSRRRFDLLLPIYRLKWCCIMLNDFLPAGGSRRRFADYQIDEVTRKTQQLQKARAALERCSNASQLEPAA